MTAMNRGLRTAGRNANAWARRTSASMSRHFQAAFRGIGLAAVGGLAIGTYALTRFTTASLRAGAKMEEVQSLFDISFKEMSASVREWAKTYSEQIGRAQIPIEDALTSFNMMFKATGLSRDAAADLAKQVTRLSHDYASAHSAAINFAEAQEKIRSGLIGMPRPLLIFGVDLRELAVKEYALREGWIKHGQELSALGKMYARWNLLLEQSQDEIGNLARTSDSVMNRARALRDAWGDLKEVFGKGILESSGMANSLWQMRENILALQKRVGPLGEVVGRFIGGLAIHIGRADTYLQEFGARWDWAASKVRTAGQYIEQSIKTVASAMAALASYAELGFAGVGGYLERAWIKTRLGITGYMVGKTKPGSKAREFYSRNLQRAREDWAVHQQATANYVARKGELDRLIAGESMEDVSRFREIARESKASDSKFVNRMAEVYEKRARHDAAMAATKPGTITPEPYRPLEKPADALATKAKKDRARSLRRDTPEFLGGPFAGSIEMPQTRRALHRMGSRPNLPVLFRVRSPEEQMVEEQKRTNTLLQDMRNNQDRALSGGGGATAVYA